MTYLIITTIVSYFLVTILVAYRMWQLKSGLLTIEELKRPTISKMLIKTAESLLTYSLNILKTGSQHGLIHILKILKKILSFSKLQVGKLERRFNKFVARRLNTAGSNRGFFSSFLEEINLHHSKVKKDLEKVYSRH